MKNIKLAIDDDVLDSVRVYPAKRRITVNAIVREELERIAKAEDRVARARRRLPDLAANSMVEMGPVNRKREDRHEH